MTTPVRDDAREPVRPGRLWLGVMAPPLAWTLAEAAGYVLTSRRCDRWRMGLASYAPGSARVATVIAAVLMALLAASALLVALRTWRATRLNRPRFMALSGAIVSALLLLNIVLFLIPAILTDACREGL